MSNTTSFVPAGEPPEGTTSTRENPDLAVYTASLATAIACTVAVDVVFLLHLYVKLLVKRTRLLPEDWSCMLAWFLTSAYTINTIADCHFGGGKDMWTISKDDYQNLLRAIYISSTIYTPAAFCTKVALLLLIARVFSVHPVLSKFIHVFIFFLLLAYLPIEAMKIAVCRPMSAYWELAKTPGAEKHCFDQTQLFMGDIMISMITDFMILLIPIPLAWKMEAPRRQKIKIMLMLGAGGAATSTTILRAYQDAKLKHSTNPSRELSAITTTSVIELSIGVLCACFPSVNFLFDKVNASISSLGSHHGRGSHHPQPIPGSEPKSTSTMSSYWSSIRPKIMITTMRTVLSTRTQQETDDTVASRHSSVPDIEMASPCGPVVFNNRLDLPSIRSTSDVRSCSSRQRDHRGLSDRDFAEQFEDQMSLKSSDYEGSPSAEPIVEEFEIDSSSSRAVRSLEGRD